MSELMMHETTGLSDAGAAKLSRASHGGRARVMTMVLEGEISQSELVDLGEMLFTLSMQGISRVVIDFGEVSHFDYRGVKPLVRRAEVFRAAGGDIKLAGLSPYLHAIFRSAGANDAFDYFAEAEDAKAAFSSSVFVQGG